MLQRSGLTGEAAAGPVAAPPAPSRLAEVEVVARAECARVGAIGGAVDVEDALLVVTGCTAALSSPTVAEDLVTTLTRVCDGKPSNRETFSVAGAIPAVIAALSTHGGANARIAAKACSALGMLALDNTVNADAFVLSEEGLGAVCLAMTSHARDKDVQFQACWLLCTLTRYISPDLMGLIREGPLPALLNTAKRNFPTESDDRSVVYYADRALAKLTA